MSSSVLKGMPNAAARSSAVSAVGTMNASAMYTRIMPPQLKTVTSANAMRTQVTSTLMYAAMPLHTPAHIAPSRILNRRLRGWRP